MKHIVTSVAGSFYDFQCILLCRK